MKLRQLCGSSCLEFACFSRYTRFLLHHVYHFVNRLNSFLLHLLYFILLSLIGFWVLESLKPRTYSTSNLDMFFTSVSAATVTSMSTVEMEVFSNAQLIVITILMFFGGEVFTSMVELCLSLIKTDTANTSLDSSSPFDSLDKIELGIVNSVKDENQITTVKFQSDHLRSSSIKFLSVIVIGYLLVANMVGFVMVLLYLVVVSSARHVLRSKGINSVTFSVFTAVSTFTGCGFVPTNENMIVFRKNTGILLMLIPLIILGNTLFPSCLRSVIWVSGMFVKKEESKYLLKNSWEVGYLHLLPSLHSSALVATVFAFICIQFVLFCSLEWNSVALDGLNSYQKVVGVLFQTINTRHTGETIVGLSTISAAILVLFILMMYLPPYTTFLPMSRGDEKLSRECNGNNKLMGKIAENLILSQLSYLVIFIILICITERTKIREDPLNFNVLNITVEVISAYGNVGFSMGYSCERQLSPDGNCKDKWYGFSGKWSDEGKIILIVVMFFGRLKKFNMKGGRAWKLL